MKQTKPDAARGVDRVQTETQFEAPRVDNVLPRYHVVPVQTGNTEVDVKDRENMIMKNTEAVTVTNFINGREGQSLWLLGDGNTTLDHGTNIFMKAGSDLLLATDKVYEFKGFIKPDEKQVKWFEI